MNVQLDWQAGNDDGKWETIAAIEKRIRLKVPRWQWGVLFAALLAFAAGGWFVVHLGYQEVIQRTAFQIQTVIDLETRALAQGNLDLFMAQQDKASPSWYARRAYCPRSGSRTPRPPLCGSQNGPLAGVAPVSPPKVRAVEMRGDVAWVEVVTDRGRARQARFYRRTSLGWLHTAPRAEFWREEVALDYGAVIVRAHKRDLPYVEPLAEHIAGVFDNVSELLDASPGSPLEVVFVPAERLPDSSEGGVTLLSPWLSGIPVGGTWSEAYLDELAYRVAYQAMSRLVRPALGQGLTHLQKAVLDEYASLYSRDDVTQAPLLRQVIERHDVDALPEVLRWLQGTRSLSSFTAQWLPPFPSEEDAYLEAILDLEREAARAGRRDTSWLFAGLRLKDRGRWEAWVERQERAMVEF